jgi:hypothetical protein
MESSKGFVEVDAGSRVNLRTVAVLVWVEIHTAMEILNII